MFAGFASTTPTDTHSVYRTFHFVFGVEHILSDSAPGHSTNRLLSFTSLRDCPCASVFDNPHLYRLFHDCLRRIALRAAF